MWFEVILACSLLLTYLWLNRPKRPPNFPPGPPTFLMFGNLPDLALSASRNFLKVAKKMRLDHNSDILGLISPTGQRLVHVFGADLIREVSNRSEFNGRPDLWPVRYEHFMLRNGIFFNDGPLWQEHRRFAIKHLRDLGLGKNVLNTMIADEYISFAELLKKLVGKEIKGNNLFAGIVLNIIWKMVASKRFENDDPERIRMKSVVENFLKATGPQSLIALFPWTRFIVPKASGFSDVKTYRTEIKNMFDTVIREHRETLDMDNPRDFVDAFLIEMQKPDAKERDFTDVNLTSIGSDFFVAGMETTTTSMTWAMLLLVHHPDVQTKLQTELDNALGGNRYPRYDDRAMLPYAEAFINEVFRYSSLVAVAVPHCNNDGPAQLAGYTIPKDTTVFLHTHSAHMDEVHWVDPDVFRPERFIGPDGKIRKDDHLMLFGLGKRGCLGESMARTEFFVFLACFLQQFRVTLPKGAPLPSMEAPYTILRSPPDFNIVLELRD